MKIYKPGDTLYLKGRYDISREVTVLEDEGMYVTVSVGFNERNRVRKERLLETPPQRWIKEREEIQKELRAQDEYLRKHFK